MESLILEKIKLKKLRCEGKKKNTVVVDAGTSLTD